jgi:hypothetical protein
MPFLKYKFTTNQTHDNVHKLTISSIAKGMFTRTVIFVSRHAARHCATLCDQISINPFYICVTQLVLRDTARQDFVDHVRKQAKTLHSGWTRTQE